MGLYERQHEGEMFFDRFRQTFQFNPQMDDFEFTSSSLVFIIARALFDEGKGVSIIGVF